MKIVTAFVPGQLRLKTVEAVCKYWHGEYVIHVLKADDPYGYARILTEHWESFEDFMVVEPDIVIRKDVVKAFKECECQYGAFPYPWTTNVGPALGCTWFRSSFLARYPNVMREVLTRQVSWNQVDVVLMRHILARRYNEQPHVHLPQVEHLNEKKQLLPEADPTPMMSLPHW